MSAASEILRLGVTLVASKPAIWREVEVPSSMTLAALHDVLQVLMDWEDYHLWSFEWGDRRFELAAVNKELSTLRAPRRRR